MKKILLFVMAVMAFAGMSVAQDVYYSGYFTNSGGTQSAAVYKNNSRLYQNGIAVDYFYGEASDVDVYNGDVYWSENQYNTSDNSLKKARVFKNSLVTVFESENSRINDLCRSKGSSGSLFVAGCKNYNNVRTAWFWRDTNGTGYQLGNGSNPSEAFGAAGNGTTMHFCGYQYSNSSTYHGVIWNGTTSVLHNFADGTKLYGMAYDPYFGYFYTVGSAVENGSIKLKVWKTNSTDGSTSLVWTLADSMSSSWVDERFSIYIDDAMDVYVNGMDGSDEKVWKNGVELYSGGYYITSVVANTNGVYYSGCTADNSGGTIWKDGSTLYSPSDCIRATNLFVEAPECTNSEVRSLPFTDSFENGNTEWPCWTKIDVDNNNGTYFSYWNRVGHGGTIGGGLAQPTTGDYCVWHQWNPNAQEGWLISPRLYLQPGQDWTRLTFKSNETNSGDYQGIWISTTDPVTSNFTEVWHQTSPSGSWKTVTVDLSEYQGHAVYIAFKYTSPGDGFAWFIDDVSVTENFNPCGAYTAPYSYDFSDGFGSCWTAYDADMTGSPYSWPYSWHPYSTWGCMCHGYSTPLQTGWLFSPRIQLPSGNYNYTLTYTSKNTGSTGTGETHTVWVAVDKTGAYVPADYTQLYSEPGYPTDWTTRTIDLSAYKGHTVSIAFKYTGNDGHTWNIDDFAITQETVQYTITANANNNAWGTVTGGGTYNAGATCTLTATPASGYQFDSWKKNGAVVSTNPNYSFTVTENATYTAYFSETPITYYTITTEVTPAGAGTVTGGGSFPAGSSITLDANANPGWTFAHWQDGNTENPRTITVNANATYTATFTQDQYTITTNVNPTGAGTVTGGGTYHYGDTPILTATANTGYEFQGWNDGNTQNPHQITVTGNASYTAIFSEVGVTMYTVTTNVSPAGAGTVTGTGTYEAGTVIVLTANANPGYTFDHWNDGNTSNPRTVTVNNALNFTAYFNQNQYTITVVADPSDAGTVSGGGAYYYGDVATLTAVAFSGFEFQGWSDGSTENPHQVTVTGNATYTATFSPIGTTYYTVSAYVSPAGAGTVSGAGTFPAGSTTTLTAIANTGYTFSHWNDGSTTNPRTVTVNNNMSFTAYFNIESYTITVNANPALGGTVTGGGTYTYGATATLTATPNANYTFLQWSDGNVDNPRYVTVTGNATYTALFMAQGGETFTLSVVSGNPLLGQVFGGGTYPSGSLVEIRALPNSYARFVKWNDGNTDNPRTVIVNSDLEFVAEFVAITNYTITVESANPDMGQAYGGGTFAEGTQIQISAVAFSGYSFSGWQDGNTQNPRTITVTGNATYIANFTAGSIKTYTLTLICNTAEGSVSGGGIYISGSTATIQAFPNNGYVFDKWSDNNTDNPRNITMTGDLTLVAFFKGTGIDDNDANSYVLYPNPATDNIRILGIEANSEIQIYNTLGELIRTVNAGPDDEIPVKDLAPGLYLVRSGKAVLRFVKTR